MGNVIELRRFDRRLSPRKERIMKVVLLAAALLVLVWAAFLGYLLFRLGVHVRATAAAHEAAARGMAAGVSAVLLLIAFKPRRAPTR
jgi:DNA-binding MurR/RpiR family transcriptional regulator